MAGFVVAPGAAPVAAGELAAAADELRAAGGRPVGAIVPWAAAAADSPWVDFLLIDEPQDGGGAAADGGPDGCLGAVVRCGAAACPPALPGGEAAERETAAPVLWWDWAAGPSGGAP